MRPDKTWPRQRQRQRQRQRATQQQSSQSANPQSTAKNLIASLGFWNIFQLSCSSSAKCRNLRLKPVCHLPTLGFHSLSTRFKVCCAWLSFAFLWRQYGAKEKLKEVRFNKVVNYGIKWKLGPESTVLQFVFLCMNSPSCVELKTRTSS